MSLPKPDSARAKRRQIAKNKASIQHAAKQRLAEVKMLDIKDKDRIIAILLERIKANREQGLNN